MEIEWSVGTVILDGGFGNELIRRGIVHGDKLWSAQALIDDPSAVKQLHCDYIDVRANIITTNSYSTIPSYLKKKGLETQVGDLTHLASRLARDAATEHETSVAVAGCIPPLSESYRPDLVIAEEDAKPVYETMVRAMVEDVDLFLCETMSCISEAIVALAAIEDCDSARDRMRFVSFTLDERPGNGLRSGASVIGGCCGIGPEFIKAISEELNHS